LGFFRENSKKQANSKKIATSEKILNDWKKFECFSLPIYEKSSFFPNLIKIFGYFYKVYIEHNGLFPNKNLVNIDLAISEFKFDEFSDKNPVNSPLATKTPEKQGNIELFKDINGKYLKIRNEALCDILELEEFNIEDKLFLNKIAFLGFRKLGQQYKFKDFHKYCRKLQVNFFIKTSNL